MSDESCTPEEYQARHAAVREALAERALDGILVADPANLHYLTGYDAWSFYTPQLAFVPLEGEIIFMTRQMDALGAPRQVAASGCRILGFPEDFVHRPDRHPGDWFAETLRQIAHPGPGTAQIAYEGDAAMFTVRTFTAIQHRLPEWNLVEGRELVNWVRQVKSDYEISLMRDAGAVCTEVMRRTVDAIEEGVPLNEVAAATLHAQAMGVDGVWGDYTSIVPMFPSGEAVDTPHLTWSDRRLPHGDAVAIELAGAHRRYHVPLARTVHLGKPSKELTYLAQASEEALSAALDAMRAGNLASDAAAAFNRVLWGYEMHKASRLGYSIGIGYPPDWGERTTSIRSDDHTELKENMTFHLIAGMWQPGTSYEISESIRVRDGEPELLAHSPRDLIVKEK